MASALLALRSAVQHTGRPREAAKCANKNKKCVWQSPLCSRGEWHTPAPWVCVQIREKHRNDSETSRRLQTLITQRIRQGKSGISQGAPVDLSLDDRVTASCMSFTQYFPFARHQIKSNQPQNEQFGLDSQRGEFQRSKWLPKRIYFNRLRCVQKIWAGRVQPLISFQISCFWLTTWELNVECCHNDWLGVRYPVKNRQSSSFMSHIHFVFLNQCSL